MNINVESDKLPKLFEFEFENNMYENEIKLIKEKKNKLYGKKFWFNLLKNQIFLIP